MEWFSLFVEWFTAQFLQWAGSISAFSAWFAAQFLQWVGASGNSGHPVTNLPGGGANPAATPELDSLVLFGSGLLGAAGYALTRLRARRQS